VAVLELVALIGLIKKVFSLSYILLLIVTRNSVYSCIEFRNSLDKTG